MKGEERDLQDLSFCFVDGKFNPVAVARDIAYKQYDELTGKGIHNGYYVTKDDRTIWRYNGGYYESDGEDEIKEKINKKLQHKIRDHHRKEVISLIKYDSELTIDREIFNTQLNKINLENGIYNTETNTLEEAYGKYFFNYQIPIKYDPDADCPKIKKFLKEVLYEGDISVVQELFGYCLYREYFIHQAFMFIGDGKNGKSTLLRLLTCFLGEKNVSSKQLQDLVYNRFSIAKLYGKLANVCNDISATALKNPARFKMLTGQDRIDAETKFKDSFEFTNVAKLIFACNKLPKTDDDSYAFMRRWILLSFPNTFEGKKCDPYILDKITTDEELSGLLNWALEGLKRIRKNSKFTYGKTVQDVAEQYKTLSDPLYAFLKEHVKEFTDGYILKNEFREKYYNWCEKHMLSKTPQNTITGEIAKHFHGMRAGRAGGKGKQESAYRNIVWVENETDEQEDIDMCNVEYNPETTGSICNGCEKLPECIINYAKKTA